MDYNMRTISMPENAHNLRVVRKLAAEKDYTLRKVRNEDLFDLIDNQTSSCKFKRASLGEMYDFLSSSDD